MSNPELRRIARPSSLVPLALLIALAFFHFRARAIQIQPSYGKQIEPILQDKCVACHNHTTRKGDLNLENYEALKAGGKRGASIIPGKSAESLLIRMIEGTVKPRMPLGDELSADEIKLIKAWIDAGARGPEGGAADKDVRAPSDAGARGPEGGAADKDVRAPSDKVALAPDLKPKSSVKAATSAISFIADNSLLAIGRYQEVELLDARDGQPIGKLTGHASQVRALAFSPDGKWLAAAGGNPAQFGEIKLWDVAARKELRTIRGHRDNIFAVAFSPDGRTIATCSYDRLVKLWDVASGNEIRNLKDHTDAVFSVAFSPDGKRLASASADRTVKIWDVATGQRLYTLSDGLDAMNSIAFQPAGQMAGKLLAGAGADRTIRIWELGETEGRQIKSLIAHEDAINLIAFSPDGKTLVSTGADKALKLWDATKLEVIHTLEVQPDWIFALTFSANGKSIAVGRSDGSIATYSAASGQLLRQQQ